MADGAVLSGCDVQENSLFDEVHAYCSSQSLKKGKSHCCTELLILLPLCHRHVINHMVRGCGCEETSIDGHGHASQIFVGCA